MVRDIINYGQLVDEAMHIIVYKVLKIVNKKGLPGNHHFFISFITGHKGVKLSKNLLNKYPREMTIVLQYQYQDMEVDSRGFGVTLSFGGIKEKIYVPFSAITTFADPSVQFGLQFRGNEYQYDEIDIEIYDDENKRQAAMRGDNRKKNKQNKKDKNNVVQLDMFRKK